jgi:hypothetical protein
MAYNLDELVRMHHDGMFPMLCLFSYFCPLSYCFSSLTSFSPPVMFLFSILFYLTFILILLSPFLPFFLPLLLFTLLLLLLLLLLHTFDLLYPPYLLIYILISYEWSLSRLQRFCPSYSLLTLKIHDVWLSG